MESKREKNLEMRERDLRRGKALQEERTKSDTSANASSKDEQEMEEVLQKVDGEFLEMTKVGDDDVH